MGTRRTIRANNSDGSNPDVASLNVSSRILAKEAGDTNYTNLSPGGVSFVNQGRMMFSEKEIIEEIKEEWLVRFFEKNGGRIAGYTPWTLEPWERRELKDGWFRDLTKSVEGREWLSKRIDAERLLRDKSRVRIAHLHTLADFGTKVGSLRYLGVSEERKGPTPEFTLKYLSGHPELQSLLHFGNDDRIFNYYSGATGSGKTTAMLNHLDYIIEYNRGNLGSYAWSQSKVRIYMPNLKWNRGTSFGFTHFWQIFMDKPKGMSIFWKKYFVKEYKAEFGLRSDPSDVFDVLVLGELGGDKMSSAMSEVTSALWTHCSLSRQYRQIILGNSANRLPVSFLIEFANPEIVMEKKGEVHYAEAQYLDKEKTNIRRVSMGRVPQHPRSEQFNSAYAADQAIVDIIKFPVKQLMAESGLSNITEYEKDPEGVIMAMSDLVAGWAEDNYENYTPGYENESKDDKGSAPASQQTVINKPKAKPVEVIKPEDSDGLFI